MGVGWRSGIGAERRAAASEWQWRPIPEAELVATWSVQDGARKTPARDRLARISVPRSGSDGAAVAADLSALLNELALRIAADIAAGDAAGAAD